MEHLHSETLVSRPLCSICGQRAGIYTCPRCSMRTCSLPCSHSHKTLKSCSGERDRTAYVPMNKYCWNTLANDYVYLEEIGRKAVEWGNDIVKGRYHVNAAAAARGRRYRRGGGTMHSGGRGKLDVLKMHLDAQDIDVEFLPAGMEKRRLNQSTWDVRRKALFITLEFIFHSAREPLSPSGASTRPSIRILAHRNHLTRTLLDTIRDRVAGHTKKEMLPSWVQSLGSPRNDADHIYLISQHTVSPTHSVSKVYHRVDASQHLAMCLRNKSFVEYPTIDVWEEGEYTGSLVETDGTFVDGEVTPPPTKRRRVDTASGQKFIKRLLSQYGSDEDRIEEVNVLGMLDCYDSEEESGRDHTTEDEGSEEKDHTVEDMYESPASEALHDILETMGQDLCPAEDHRTWPEEDDETDWIYSSEGEADAFEQAKTKSFMKSDSNTNSQ